MLTNYETKQIVINCSAGLRGYKQGKKVNIQFYKNTKIPVDVYWRRRLKDAEKDNCIKIIEPNLIPKDKLKTKEKDNKDECDIRAEC